MKFNLRQRLLATTLLGVAFAATPAWAQEDDQANQENAASAVADPTNSVTEANEADTDDGEIVVTGSRIARRDLVSSSPLAVVQDEEFKLSGSTNVEQVINTLPQVIPGTTAFSNNPGGGVATLDLRGLGTSRNLILVNGRRYIFFDASQIVDVNTIPSFLIDSVDVVTGGASAVYGSDALAGVINFRLRNDLNGFETGGQVSLTEEGDGRRMNGYMALGSGFADGRGHVTVFGEYFERKGVFANARLRSRVTQGDITGGLGLVPTGSATTERGRFAIAGTQDIAAGNGLAAVTLPRGAGNFGTAFGADFQTPGVSSVFDNPADSFNFAPTNYLAVPQERFSLGGYGEYEISDAVTAYAEVNFINNRVQNELAATPVTGTIVVGLNANTRSFLSNADFAALEQLDRNETAIDAARAARGLGSLFTGGLAQAAQPGFVALGVNRRVTETGSRNSFDERNAFRVLAGVKGQAFADFNYDLSYFYSRTRNANIQQGNISRSAFNAGVLNGTINVFGPGTLTPEDVDSISILAQNNEISTLQVASASLAGSLFNFGQGASDVGVALGAEYRKVAAEFIPDTALSSGDVVGFNAGNPTAGGYDVKELFGELRVPIAAGLSFVNLLELNGAVRYSDYSLDNVGGVFTYAGGATFSPVRDITFRGQYQRAVRAPNVQELFGGQQINFPTLADPCSDRTSAATRTEAVRQRCIADGVPAGAVFTRAVQPNTQAQSILGGNPNLQEETSDSYTVGVVLRPRFIPRLNITIDAFKIDIEGTIGAAGGGENNILNLCYVGGQDQFCDLIQRNPSNGIIEAPFVISAFNLNQGKLETQGIDLQVDYSQPLGFGMFGQSSKLNFFFLGTYTDKFDITPTAGGTPIECADRFGLLCNPAGGAADPRPAFKWTSRLSLIDGPLTTSVRWRHLSSTRDDNDNNNFTVERLRPYDLIDLAFSADVTDAVSFTFGVNNLFDKKPQVIGSNAEQSNTYPGTFDVLGRDYFVSGSFRF
jgi:outer membrane receptor protein involved in Fe transport